MQSVRFIAAALWRDREIPTGTTLNVTPEEAADLAEQGLAIPALPEPAPDMSAPHAALTDLAGEPIAVPPGTLLEGARPSDSDAGARPPLPPFDPTALWAEGIAGPTTRDAEIEQ